MSAEAQTAPIEIKLINSARPSKATSDEVMRPALSQGFVVEEDGRRVLITTDSYILSRTLVPDTTPLGPIHGGALVHIEDRKRHSIEEGKVIGYDEGIETVWRPPFDGIFETKKPPKFDPEDAEHVVTIGLNPTLLLRLAEAIGAVGAGVKLEIAVTGGGSRKPMRVSSLGPSDSEGVMMPILVKS